MTRLACFVTAPRNTGDLLADELRALGVSSVSMAAGGVGFETDDLHVVYRVCLNSRVASRVLLRVDTLSAPDTDALYAGIHAFEWTDHVPADGTLAVTVTGSGPAARHSGYAALKTKDAIVDRLREACGRRPSIDTRRPDVRVHVHISATDANIYIDLAGDPLHRRGYRARGVAAPLKENLAAAVLLRAGWPDLAAEGAALLDPMCGSATLPIEAAWMAADTAPGLGRSYWGFSAWPGHDERAWQTECEAARDRAQSGRAQVPSIRGYEASGDAVRAAQANVDSAGLNGVVHIERRALADCAPAAAGHGLVIANPPYGQRLGRATALRPLYAELGRIMAERFVGWRGAVLTGDPELGHALGLRAERVHQLYNGTIPCKLLHFDLSADRVRRRRDDPFALPPERRSEGAVAFANRLAKNLRHLGKWARRSGIDCYRLYDRDLPEYAVAVDRYRASGGKVFAHVQEYEAPRGVDARLARRRLREIAGVVADTLGIDAGAIVLKTRRRQRGGAQYEREGQTGEFLEVAEGGCRFLVNLRDYLDTGLFLDHRKTRALVGELAAGRRFLNLFGYTGTATVYAARGGATQTTTVDLSNTYLDWARRNLALNGFDDRAHRLVRDDCLQWLGRTGERSRYELIFCDPPTFSRSSRMQSTFDVQRDHVSLIGKAAQCLAPGGVIVFSCNLRGFRLDRAALTGWQVDDLSAATLPRDFARNPKIHRVFKLEKTGTSPAGRQTTGE